MKTIKTILEEMQNIAFDSHWREVKIEEDSPLNIRHYDCLNHKNPKCPFSKTIIDKATYKAYLNAVHTSILDWRFLGRQEDESNYCQIEEWMNEFTGELIAVRILPSLLGITH